MGKWSLSRRALLVSGLLALLPEIPALAAIVPLLKFSKFTGSTAV